MIYKRWYEHERAKLEQLGKWEEPPFGVPMDQWVEALHYGYADRYRPLPLKKVTDEEYAKIQKEMYGDD